MWSKFQNKEELERMLEGKTPVGLASDLGVSWVTIYRAIHRLGIPFQAKPHKYSGFGDTHKHWKGGRHKNGEGYILIYTGKESYRLEHHLVIEKMLGRPLRKGEQVHHKNRVKDDNRPENLKIILTGKHYDEVLCPWCGKGVGVK